MATVSKVLLVGSDQVWSIERFYLKYLRQVGVDAELFAIQDDFFKYYQSGILNKIQVRLGLSDIYRTLGKLLLSKFHSWKPQVVWVFKGMEVLPSVIKEMHKTDCIVVNYNPDNPFIFTGRGSGNTNVTRSIPLYHLHLTYDNQIAKLLQDRYSVRTSILPFGFDLPTEIYEESLNEKEIIKVCFVGNPDPDRASFIQKLAGKISIDVYGNGWNNHINHTNATIYEPVYGTEFWKVLRRYRVQLNLMRIHNPDSHNMRSFEIPAIGGIGLFPKTVDHVTYFKPGEEVFVYNDFEQCVSVAQQLLSLNEVEANLIRNKARSRSVNSGYSYRDRTQQLIQILDDF